MKTRELKGRVVARQEPLDLALIEVDPTGAQLGIARLAPPKSLERAAVFSRVWAVGCPLGYAPLPPAGVPIIDNTSRRVVGSVRNKPSMRLVTMLTPGLWTPRVVMH